MSAAERDTKKENNKPVSVPWRPGRVECVGGRAAWEATEHKDELHSQLFESEPLNLKCVTAAAGFSSVRPYRRSRRERRECSFP